MRLEKTIQLSTGHTITVKEITPAIWNNICNFKGESLLKMNISTVMDMELGELTALIDDMLVLPEERTITDLGYTGLIECWTVWREVNESFLSLLVLAQQPKASPAQEPAAKAAE